ncbi:MAG TPA: hypothetical protein VK997_05570 [Deferrisomatales bacterium]|nr:hypothetical protein [Deferrisomatales bacterium]
MALPGSLRRTGLWVTCAGLALAGLWCGPGSQRVFAQVTVLGGGRGGPPAGAPVVPYQTEPAAQAPAPRAEISGGVRTVAGTPAPGVEVRFWPREAEGLGEPKTATTDPSGVYRLELGDGTWVGSACGPDHLPGGWEVAVADGRVSRFQEAGRLAPEIRNVEVVSSGADGTPRPGDRITLRGAGFGCSGRALVEFPGLLQVATSRFTRRDDGVVEFPLPEPPETGQDRPLILRELLFRYERSGLQSGPAAFRVLPTLRSASPPQTGALSTTPSSGSRAGSLLPALSPRR